jgi:hypothetical protein
MINLAQLFKEGHGQEIEIYLINSDTTNALASSIGLCKEITSQCREIRQGIGVLFQEIIE